ncbi:MAG: hypothetical protein HKP61_08455 [Dactylosporangium sp.]|nr:hypothetical protein [Dactylosporangium sp.]NNJ60968.1 hypothetical protein [Dactylosporangium sp.]
MTWEPFYDGVAVTRIDWWRRSEIARNRVLREWKITPERLADGSLQEVQRIDGVWR